MTGCGAVPGTGTWRDACGGSFYECPPPINYGGKVQQPPGRRGCRRDYHPRGLRPLVYPACPGSS